MIKISNYPYWIDLIDIYHRRAYSKALVDYNQLEIEYRQRNWWVRIFGNKKTEIVPEELDLLWCFKFELAQDKLDEAYRRYAGLRKALVKGQSTKSTVEEIWISIKDLEELTKYEA
jgi:hypothetical protein